jgi:hypothetical protein
MNGLEGILYGFDRHGEGLMMHAHDSDTAHDITVMKGAIKIHGKIPSKILVVGEQLDFDWRADHEVLALENNTVIFNRFIYGVTCPFRDLPMHLRNGHMDDTLHNAIPYHLILR